ncbi:helix-turn-helix domain-containing protein [Actinoplanes sp. NPDC024001]|uniref:winged helix-turn-helix transcriptional regulator n=1 Tax=Actinoplanes sp. NPDC024001 TaxID=3154598 RepID=UPI00340D8167
MAAPPQASAVERFDGFDDIGIVGLETAGPAGVLSQIDGCAVAHSLDLLGERWALLVVRELVLGPKRFTDLRAGLPGADADMLSQRLRELQSAGVVRRHRTPPPASAWVYELTPWGLELEPVFSHLGRWGSRSPGMRHDAPIGVDSLMLSLRALFSPAAADGLTATVALTVDGQDFQVHVGGGRLEVTRADRSGPARASTPARPPWRPCFTTAGPSTSRSTRAISG